MMFLLIMLLQGIWLPLHGYSYESTPFWAGIFMLPLTAGFVIMGPSRAGCRTNTVHGCSPLPACSLLPSRS